MVIPGPSAWIPKPAMIVPVKIRQLIAIWSIAQSVMESLNQFPEDVAPSALQVSFGIKALTHSILHIFYSFLSLLASYFWHASIIPLFKRLCFYVLLAFLCSFCLSHILLFLVDCKKESTISLSLPHTAVQPSTEPLFFTIPLTTARPEPEFPFPFPFRKKRVMMSHDNNDARAEKLV